MGEAQQGQALARDAQPSRNSEGADRTQKGPGLWLKISVLIQDEMSPQCFGTQNDLHRHKLELEA